VPYPSITVRNVGGQTLSWNAGVTVATASVTPSSGRLGQGQSQQLTVTQPGPINTATNVTITSNGGNAIMRFTCAAPGLHGNLVANPTTLALGNYCGDSFNGVGITLSNTGNGPLTWSQSGGAGFSLAPSSGTLNAGVSLGIGVSGTKANASFGIAWQGGSGGGTKTVTVSTSCVAPPPPPPPPHLTLNRSQVGINCGQPATVTLGNSGGQTLTWSIDSSDGNGATASPASGSIAPGQTTPVMVSGGPNDPSLLGYLFIYSNGGNASITVTWLCLF
jgi:hypothetical protein